MQNEANRAKRTQLPEAGHRGGVRRAGYPRFRYSTIPALLSHAFCAKQSQFPPRRRERQRLCEKGVIVNSTSDRPRQNKANSGGSDASGGTTGRAVAWARYAKQTQFRQREGKGQVLCGKGVMVNRTVYRPRRNKANSLSRPPAWGQLYEQSQSGGVANRAKQTQCPKRGTEAVSSIADCGLGTDLQWDTLRGPPGRGAIVQTNPISATVCRSHSL